MVSDYMKKVLEMAGIEESLEEMAYPANFNLQEFSQLPSFQARKKYCDERLQKLGTGSSRIVYKIDDQKALKIAKNKKGLAQNEHEADWGRNQYEIFAYIYEADTDNYTWIEMELAKKAKSSDFPKILGITWPQAVDLIKYCFEQLKNVKMYYSTNVEELYNKLIINEESDFFCHFQRYVYDYAPYSVMDWTSLRNWGIVNRNGKDELVIIDDGLDELVWKTYYMRAA